MFGALSPPADCRALFLGPVRSVIAKLESPMTERSAKPMAVSLVIALLGMLTSGCVCVTREPTTEPVVSTAPSARQIPAVEVPAGNVSQAGTAITGDLPVEAPEVPAPANPGASAPQAEAARDAKAAAPMPAPSVVRGSKPAPTKPPAVIAATPTPAPRQLPKVAPTLPAPPPISAPLDLSSLETRLRQTKAIGVMTKLSLKNQIDDLLDQFRAYHKRQGTTTIAELRRGFDMLLLKVLSLLQDSDPPLARDIVKSRAAIWGILENPRKFDEFNRMAGETP